MKTTWMWLLAAVGALALTAAGCGGDDGGDSTTADEAPATLADVEVDSGPFETDEEFISAIDSACDDYSEFYMRAPVYGIGAEGLAAEFANRIEINEAYQSAMETIEPTETHAGAYADYLEAGAELNANEERVLAAAEKGDEEEANRILNEDNTDAIERYDAAAEELGACSSIDPPEAENTAEATEAAADAPQPSNSIDEAAEEYVEAVTSGDCKLVQKMQHSQLYAEQLDDCSDIAADNEGYEVLATAQYGPVGAAMVGTEEGSSYISFVLDPAADDALKYTGSTWVDSSGLEPPNEGIDADETASQVVEAMRNDDVDAFNETLPLDGVSAFLQKGDTIESIGDDPEYANRIVEDIKASDAEPVLLGADQTAATYLLDTEGADYLLVMRHEPGSETDYQFAAYWAITE